MLCSQWIINCAKLTSKINHRKKTHEQGGSDPSRLQRGILCCEKGAGVFPYLTNTR